MNENTILPELILPDNFSDRTACEMTWKGYYPVDVKLGDGSVIRLTFFDPGRLNQDICDQFKEGEFYFAEPNLIIIPEVKLETINAAILSLWEEGFFSRLKPG
jgi:hypothetical protein